MASDHDAWSSWPACCCSCGPKSRRPGRMVLYGPTAGRGRRGAPVGEVIVWRIFHPHEPGGHITHRGHPRRRPHLRHRGRAGTRAARLWIARSLARRAVHRDPPDERDTQLHAGRRRLPDAGRVRAARGLLDGLARAPRQLAPRREARARRPIAAVAEAINASEPVTMAVSDGQFEHCRTALSPVGPGGRDLHRRRLDARHRPDLPRRRRAAACGASTGASTPGAAWRAASTSPGTATSASRAKVLEIEGAGALPGADRARGRLDPRRRRGNGDGDRRVPAQPNRNPDAHARADRAGCCFEPPRCRADDLAGPRASTTTRPTATSTTSPASPGPAWCC